ncbi:MAG: aminotransferase class I/II-fold pyridoxal phosphate-dependent enzyme [Paracoccaceae bacterium]
MVFPERFSNLPEYAFPRLRSLLDGQKAGGDVIRMSIGEPRHPFPDWVGDIIADNIDGFGKYPPTDGTPQLRRSIADWIRRRFGATLDPDTNILPLSGTREGLFNACIAMCPEKSAQGKQPIVLIPNPFYQAYGAGALAAGAQPHYVSATAATGFLPDYQSLDPEILDRTEIAFICSPSNPQGAVASPQYLSALFALAEKHDFRIFSDECYSEIYRDTPPAGALEVAHQTGADPERVFVFHSLSKRSNLPGMRSGFIAGGAGGIARLKRLRNYGGAPIPLPLQQVSQQAWSDEDHVQSNRAQYQKKFQAADRVFASLQGYGAPQAGFFLWLPVDDGEAAVTKLWTQTGVLALPGAYLSREIDGENPGKKYIRVAMVAPYDEMQLGLTKTRDCLYE